MEKTLFFRVVDHEKHQHYKRRNAPWIKLHSERLDDPRFGTLPDETKAHLMLIECLVARTGNRLPFDEKFVRARINARKKVNLQLLLDRGFIALVDSAPLADGSHAASPEAEAEEEAEKRAKADRSEPGRQTAVPPSNADAPVPCEDDEPLGRHERKAIEVLVYWRDLFGKSGEKLTDARRSAIRSALEHVDAQTIRDGLSGALLHPEDFTTKDGRVYDDLTQLLRYPDRLERWAKDHRDSVADEEARQRRAASAGRPR